MELRLFLRKIDIASRFRRKLKRRQKRKGLLQKFSSCSSGDNKAAAERLKRHIASTSVHLIITHTWGGGIQKYIIDKAARLRRDGVGFLLLPPFDYHLGFFYLSGVDDQDVAGAPLVDLRSGVSGAAELLETFNIKLIEVHSLVGWPLGIMEEIPMLSKALGVAYEFYLHDYLSICPQITFIEPTSKNYCGEQGEEQCRACLAKSTDTALSAHGRGAVSGKGVALDLWRNTYKTLLLNAVRVIAPNDDTADRVKRYIPTLEVLTVPHEEDLSEYRGMDVVKKYSGGEIEVLLLGGIYYHKGYIQLRECARDALERKLPLKFIVVGDTASNRAIKKYKNIKVLGRYNEDDLPAILQQHKAHAMFFSSICPETFSYTLSIALACRFPIIAFDIGAPAQRLREVGNSKCLPLAFARKPAALNDAIIDHVINCNRGVNSGLVCRSLKCF